MCSREKISAIKHHSSSLGLKWASKAKHNLLWPIFGKKSKNLDLSGHFGLIKRHILGHLVQFWSILPIVAHFCLIWSILAYLDLFWLIFKRSWRARALLNIAKLRNFVCSYLLYLFEFSNLKFPRGAAP